jgi:hypothetical protein
MAVLPAAPFSPDTAPDWYPPWHHRPTHEFLYLKIIELKKPLIGITFAAVRKHLLSPA